jgi:Mg-chelatase subunit ChlD
MNDLNNITEKDRKYLESCWKLILGKASESSLGGMDAGFGGQSLSDMNQLLEFLYAREYEDGSLYDGDTGGGVGGKAAGKGSSNPTVFKWLKDIRNIFPKKTIEILEKDAINKYDLKEMLTDKKVLESMEPNKALLETILNMKEHMSPDVLMSAKRIIKSVVDEIKLRLEEKVSKKFSSLLNRSKSSVYSISGELDFNKTINKNLKNFDPKTQKIGFEDIYFYENIHKKNKWNLVLVVDESGSMMDSVLYSSIMASIFASIPVLRTKLVIFDTEVVDLSDHLDDVVEIMFQIRLGGGTDIAKALNYTSSKYLDNPHKTIVVLVSDFYDWDMNKFYAEVAYIIDAGAKFIGIGALTEDAKGSYDKQAAKKLASMGAEVAALTPESLAEWVKKIIG